MIQRLKPSIFVYFYIFFFRFLESIHLEVNIVYLQKPPFESCFSKNKLLDFVHFSHFSRLIFYILTFCTNPIFGVKIASFFQKSCFLGSFPFLWHCKKGRFSENRPLESIGINCSLQLSAAYSIT